MGKLICYAPGEGHGRDSTEGFRPFAHLEPEPASNRKLFPNCRCMQMLCTTRLSRDLPSLVLHRAVNLPLAHSASEHPLYGPGSRTLNPKVFFEGPKCSS